MNQSDTTMVGMVRKILGEAFISAQRHGPYGVKVTYRRKEADGSDAFGYLEAWAVPDISWTQEALDLYLAGMIAHEAANREVFFRPPATIGHWRDAKKRLADIKGSVKEAEVALKKADEKHREQHPLSPEMKKRIIEAFDGGQKLCCGGGQKFLESLGLDENWVEHLNEWAYENLACTPNTLSKTGRYHDKAVETLRQKMEKC